MRGVYAIGRSRGQGVGVARALLTAAVALGAGAAVGAEPRPAEVTGDLSLAEWPREVARRPLTIPRGSLELILPLNSNLSSGSVGEPVFSNPSLYYGVTPRLMVGLRHFLGVCVGGADDGCPRVYNDASLDAAWSPYRVGGVEVGVGGALNAGFGDDTTLAGEVRVYGKLARGRLALLAAPQLSFGLNNRDRPTATGGGFSTSAAGLANREILTLPLTAIVQVTDALAFSLGAALSGPLNPPEGSFGDLYRVPVGLTATWAASSALDLGAAFTLADVGGEQGDFDQRFGKVFVTLRR